MSKMLERVMSLVPKKPNGDFVHGAKSEFARSLGFKNGAVVSDWEAGKSDSYKNYLYQISALYNVSVEWLRGETDDPEIKKDPPQAEEGLSDMQLKAMRFVQSLSDDDLRRFIKMGEAAFGELEGK